MTARVEMPPGPGDTPGERWAREELARLRRGGYKSWAWAGFLAASLDRAAETRASRPRLNAQVDRWLVAWLALAAGSRLPGFRQTVPPVPARSELLWAASAWAMLRWHLGMVEGPAGEPRGRLSAADAASVSRVWLSPRIMRAGRHPRAFAGLVVLAAATDALDGALARRSGATRLGRDLDSIADACAAAAACLAARPAGWIERPAALAVATRYGAGLGYALWRYLAGGARPVGEPPAVARALAPCSLVAIAAEAVGHARFAGRAVTVMSLAALWAGVTRNAASGRAARTARSVSVAESAKAIQVTTINLRRGNRAEPNRRARTADP